MAASKIKVEFLHCDQGMGSLIRIYNSAGKLENLALIDLGSESGTKRYAGEAVADIIEALKEMQADGMKPRISLMIVSHQDYDHWSLLPDLIDEIISELPNTEVDEIYYGGARWRPAAVETLKAFKREFGVEAIPLPRAHTDYDTPGKKTELATIDGVTFRTLAVNVPCSRSADDLVRNGTSAVMVCEFGGTHCIFPGDATADTVGFINRLVFDPWDKAGKGVPTRPCRALSAPHHGALRTIASNFTTKGAKLDIARTFSLYVEAENVIASAGYYSKFKHPYKSVMEQLGVKARDAGEHGLVVYDETIPDWQHFAKFKKGLYTTVETLDTPPSRVGWTFSISSTGVITFELEQPRVYYKPEARTPNQTDRYPAVPTGKK